MPNWVWSKDRGKVSWLSAALIVLVMSFTHSESSKLTFLFSPSYLFHLCETRAMSILLRQSWKLHLALMLSPLPQTSRKTCGIVSTWRAKGTPFQTSLPVPKQYQIPTLQAEVFLFEKATWLSLYLPCTSASRVADGMAPVPSKFSKPPLPVTQAGATSGSMEKAIGYEVRVLQGSITRLAREEPARTLRLNPSTLGFKLITVQMEWVGEHVWSN